MKRILIICASVMTLLAPFHVSAESAIVISFDGCSMADYDGDFFTTQDVKVVFSRNAVDGNITLKCSAKGLENPTGNPVKYNYENTEGALCTFFEGAITTDQWMEVISTAGNATLTCQFESDFIYTE